MKNHHPTLLRLPLILAAMGIAHNTWATLHGVQTTSSKCLGRLLGHDGTSPESIPRQPNEIGRGKMSVITKEQDGENCFAVKRLNDEPSFTPTEWAQVKDSTKIAQELHAKFGEGSPVVNVHSYEQHEKSATIKMDYIEGDNLHMHLQKHFQNSGLNEKTLGTAIDLLALVIKNTEDLANENVLNPDLKAQNMMVTKNKKGENVIKTIDPESLVRTNPTTKGLDTFPNYVSGMSPEMIQFRNSLAEIESEELSDSLTSMFGTFVRAKSMNYSLGLLIESEILKPFRNAIQPRDPFSPKILRALDELDKLSKRLLEYNQMSRADTREATFTVNKIREELRRP